MRNTLAFTRRYLATIPLSIAFAVLILITSLVAGTFFGPPSEITEDTWAAGVTTVVDMGHWWTVFTALFIPWDPFQLVAGILASLVLLGVAERLLGRLRMVAVFLVTGLIGVGLGVLLQWVGSLAGEWWADGTSYDLTVDPLTPIVGALLAASSLMGPLWRRRVRLVAFGLLIMFALYVGDTSTVYRLIAAIAGLVIGHVISGRSRRVTWLKSSFVEARVLIAAIVVIVAVGPLTSWLDPNGSGAFGLAGSFYGDIFPTASDIQELCANASSAVCDDVQRLAQLGGIGPIVQTFVPLALLLVAAWGLRRGRRFALWLGIVVNLGQIVLAFVFLSLVASFTSTDATDTTGLAAIDIGEYIVWGGSTVAVPAAVAILLFVNRKRFALKSPREAVIRFSVTVAAAFAVLALVYSVAGAFVVGAYIPQGTTVVELVLDLPRRFLPVTIIGVTQDALVPPPGLVLVLFQWIGPAFWAVFTLASLQLLTADDQTVRVGDHQRIRALLRRGGGGTLGWMTTWPGNVYWFNAAGDAAVAYRVINGVAITMSDPVCKPGDERQTVRDFAAFCDANSWVPVFYSVHEQFLPVFDEMEWQYMSVGEETLMHPQTLEMTGKAWQNVRSSLNRGVREGMTTLWTTYDELSRPYIAQINAISEAWVSEKELPEMGFTLGALEEIKDPDVKLMLALDASGRIAAVTSWLPMYRDGRAVGYTLDFMRRADESMGGTMEYLIASSALHMKEEGVEVLSLSGAPLAQAPVPKGEEPPAPTVMTGLSEFLAKTLEPAYGFSSLFKFKAKFNPSYSTIYMAYPDPLALPTIGGALGKAYLPTMSAKEAVSLVRTLVR
ncbi:phosphatidylglycerol lysyltransferase domain-containing protein [Herbiconiux sp. KACC 21604]|uniref:rhomboid family intramembrane serine protease n=1 Tax=unclassified Herbiconiux TaxID=2618217 RepID=UPI0014923B65|nr:rhomboid family intramembrane serine protease [Herbiconiux sp. SALV-R1]QJU54457.1 rhomboid family intramembrane serine protease [Herbiconiux sp. SALV-R1]WPO85535.1 phosphatidylglycerol lysyltransferase domain-containing protein [Herbiconiux sp. KACC 21604]